MPNTPAQFPNFDLPGAEWFGLSPNQTIAIQGRRSTAVSTPSSIPVPANSTAFLTATAVIESGFLPTSGIYVHSIIALLAPADTSQSLELTAFQMGFGLNPANPVDIFFRIGQAPSILTNPSGVNTITSDRDMLITGKDIISQGESPVTTNLVLAFSGFFKNLDATNPHSMFIQTQILYTRLDGFTT